VAWREGGRVRWQKNLNTGETLRLLKKLDGEVIIHFRWASVGGIDPRLCHPFPVTPKASTSLSGMAESVLFHNGTWSGYEDALKRLAQHRKEPVPVAPMSVSVTVTPIGTRLERGAWGVRDVRRYGQPNHDFETGRTRSCAQHG
jgi:hypothetical protein